MSDATRAAGEAAEAVRALNRATLWPEGYAEPAEVDRVVSELQALAERLPQAFGQASQWLAEQRQRGTLAHDEQPDGAGVLGLALETARYNLARAADHAQEVATHLARARTATSHLRRP